MLIRFFLLISILVTVSLAGCGGPFFVSSGSAANGTNSGTGAVAHFAYVADAPSGSTGGVIAYSINSDGTLNGLNGGTPYIDSDENTEWLAIGPSNSYLYVANAGTTGSLGAIDLWTINGDGSLGGNGAGPAASFGNTDLQNPTTVAVTPNGLYLYATYTNPTLAGTAAGLSGAYVAGYAIGSGGTLTSISQAEQNLTLGSATPASISIDSTGSYLYAVTMDTSIYVFDINSDGTLTATVQAGSSPLSLSGVEQLAIMPNDAYAFAATGSTGLTGYALSSGALTSYSGNTTSISGGVVSGVATDYLNQWVYGLDADSNVIYGFTIGSGGVLTAMTTPTFPTGNAPSSIAVSPSNLNLYVTNASDDTVTVYAIAGGGLLTSLGTIATSNTTGSNPRYILIAE